MSSASALAANLKEDGIAKLLKSVGDEFPDYYAKGKEMAQTYVAEGPAGGNRMMASFDEVASQLTGTMDEALKTTAARKADIEAAGNASVKDVEAAVERNRTFFGMLTLALGGLAFLFSAATAVLSAVLQRQALRQQARAEELSREQEEEREKNARDTALVISGLGEGLDKLSAGDLSRPHRPCFPGRDGEAAPQLQ